MLLSLADDLCCSTSDRVSLAGVIRVGLAGGGGGAGGGIDFSLNFHIFTNLGYRNILSIPFRLNSQSY